MRRFPRKLKKQIKRIPYSPYCYGTPIGEMGKKRRTKRGGCCPFFHDTNSDYAYCSFTKQHDDLELTDQVKICGNYEDVFDINTGKLSKAKMNAPRVEYKRPPVVLDKFLIIHEKHDTGLRTMGTWGIKIEEIPNADAKLISEFNSWHEEARKCQNKIMLLKRHYRKGFQLARRIKRAVGEEILVDYWWINPTTIKKGEKREWQGVRVGLRGCFYFYNDYERVGWIPASPYNMVNAFGIKTNFN